MPQLAEELICAIAGCLRDDEIVDSKSLARMSWVNKTFARVVRPLLYSTFDHRHFGRPPQGFVTALIKDESLIPLVREVRLAQSAGDDDVGKPVDGNLQTQIMALANTLPIPVVLKVRLIEQLSRCSHGGYVALLLIMCPNIELLEIDDGNSGKGPEDDTGITNMVIKTRETPRVYMSHLKEVIMHHWEGEGKCYMDELRWLSQHPTVHTLRGYKLECTAGSLEGMQPCTGLKYMCLEGFEVDRPGFEEMLNAFPALEELAISFGDGTCGCAGDFYADIGSILSRHGLRLRVFVLEIWNAGWHIEPGDEGDVEDKVPLGDLSALPTLTYLSLPEEALLGSREDIEADLRDRDKLPPNIKALEITLCDGDTDKLDDELMQVIRTNRHGDLDIIAIERTIPFSHDLKPIGWTWGWIGKQGISKTWRHDSQHGSEAWDCIKRKRNGDTWQVLKRVSVTNGTGVASGGVERSSMDLTW